MTAVCTLPSTYSINGRVLDSQQNPIQDVLVSSNAGHHARTDSHGYYTFQGVLAGTYTLTPFKTNHTFSPASLTVIVPPNSSAQDFTGTAQSERLIDVTISLCNNPQSAEQRALYEHIIEYFADAVFESSNGAHKIGTVTIYPNKTYWDQSHIRWMQSCWLNAKLSGYPWVKAGFRMQMCDVFEQTSFLQNDEGHAHGGYVLGHEWGHYYYSLYDEYQGNDPCDSSNVGNPCRDDKAVDRSIMHNQWRAFPDNYAWLNFSTDVNHTRNTVQHRVYRASRWETLARPPSQDPVHPNARGIAPRLYYPELAAVAPAPGQLPRIDLVPGHTARSALAIIWPDSGSVRAKNIRYIIIDASSEITGSGQLADRKELAKYLLDQATIGSDATGILSFAQATTVVQPITLLDSEATRDTIKAAIDAIPAGTTATAMGAALEQALDDLQTFSQDNPTSKKSVYLLTESDFSDIANSRRRIRSLPCTQSGDDTPVWSVIPKYQAASVSIDAFGLGYGSDLDSVILLDKIAQETGGLAHFIKTTPAPNDPYAPEVDSAFAKAVHASIRADHRATPVAEADIVAGSLFLQNTETISVPIHIDSTLTGLEVIVVQNTPDHLADVTLLSPTGAVLNPVECATMCRFRVDTPTLTTGEWMLQITGSGSPTTITYRATGIAEDNTFRASIVSLSGNVISYPEPLLLMAMPQRTVPIAGAVMRGTVEAPDGTKKPFDLLDDGIAPDHQANDGIYVALLDYTQEGHYTIHLHVDNSVGTARETHIGVELAPDENGSVDTPDDVAITENFVRIAETQVFIADVRSDDHGNTPDGATAMNADNVGVAGRIDATGDVDIFRVTILTDGPTNFRISNVGLGINPQLRLLASDGKTELATATLATSDRSEYVMLSRNLKANDVVYAIVSDRNANVRGGVYTMSTGPPLIDEQPEPADEPEDPSEPTPPDSRIYLPIIRR